MNFMEMVSTTEFLDFAESKILIKLSQLWEKMHLSMQTILLRSSIWKFLSIMAYQIKILETLSYYFGSFLTLTQLLQVILIALSLMINTSLILLYMDVWNQSLESIHICISGNLTTNLLSIKKFQTLKQNYALDFIKEELMRGLLVLNGRLTRLTSLQMWLLLQDWILLVITTEFRFCLLDSCLKTVQINLSRFVEKLIESRLKESKTQLNFIQFKSSLKT